MEITARVYGKEDLKPEYRAQSRDESLGWWRPRLLLVPNVGKCEPPYPDMFSGYYLDEQFNSPSLNQLLTERSPTGDLAHTISEFTIHALTYGNSPVLYLGVSRSGAEKAQELMREGHKNRLSFDELAKSVDDLLLVNPVNPLK